MTLDQLKDRCKVLDQRLRDELGMKTIHITLDPDFKVETEEDKLRFYRTTVSIFEKLLDGELDAVESVEDAPEE